MPLNPMPSDYINATGYSDLSNVTSLDDLKQIAGKIPQKQQSTVPTVEIPELSVGDWVQIKLGAQDITNGKIVNTGDLYAENSDAWGKVLDINDNYNTNGKFNLPNKISAVQIGTRDGTVMQTVMRSDVAKNRILNNSSKIALQSLSPIGNLLNLNIKDLSSIGNIISSSDALITAFGGNSKTLQGVKDAWNKVLYYDNFISTKYKEGEALYNSILNLFGKNKQQTNTIQKVLGVLGAGSNIQNYIKTTRLIDKRQLQRSTSPSQNGLQGLLNKVTDIFSKASSVYNAINNFTGSSTQTKGVAQSGLRTQQVNFPSSLMGMYGMTNISGSSATAENSKTLSKIALETGINTGIPGTTRDSDNSSTGGTYNSVEYAKLIGQAIKDGNETEIEQAKKLEEDGSFKFTYRSLTEEEQKRTWIRNLEGLKVVNNVENQVFDLFPAKEENLNIITNENKTLIQNAFGFPNQTDKKLSSLVNQVREEEEESLKVRQYDYQIKIDDPNIAQASDISIEDRLMKARAQFGLQVHGNTRLGKAIKYFLYNRYKNIDGGNLAWNRMVTHVFFTRPDLNLLYNNGPLLSELRNFSEVTLLWQRDPNLFRLLTDCNRTGESFKNNFNLLLSNQIANFEFKDETISKVESTKTWKDQKIIYGGSYTGRGDGEISCTFIETRELSITNLIRLWIMYIDNVTSGIWRPSYNLYRKHPEEAGGLDLKVNYGFTNEDKKLQNANDSLFTEKMSHIYTRTLDYAASCYAFKLREDGEEIMYWTKYYGLIPTSLSLSHLNWQAGSPDSDVKTVNVTFAYSFKKDLSPISLLEFNANSYIQDEDNQETPYEPNFDTNYDIKHEDGTYSTPSGVRSGVPLVGAPFITIRSIYSEMKRNKSNFLGYGASDNEGNEIPFSLRLKFKPVPNTDNYPVGGDPALDYKQIYRHAYSYNSQGQKQWSVLNSLIQNSVQTPNTEPANSIVNEVNGKVTNPGTTAIYNQSQGPMNPENLNQIDEPNETDADLSYTDTGNITIG